MKKTTFSILCLEGAILSFNVAAASALIPSIAADFALSQFFVGKIIWLYMLPYGLAAFFYGPLVRIVDARRVELICIFLFSLANLLAGLSPNISILFISRFLMGLFGASVIPLGLILIAKRIEQSKRGTFIGIFFGSTFIASLLGLFLSGFIYWRMIFIIPAILGFSLWVFMFIYLPNFREGFGNFRFGYLRAFKDQQVIRIFIYIFLISLIYHAVQQWLGVYFSTQFLLNQFTISTLITLTSLSGVFGEFWGGSLCDKLSRQKIVTIGIAVMMGCIFALLMKLPVSLLSVIMILWGIGWTFNHVGMATMLTDLPGEFLNEAASLNSGVRFISGGIGACLGGVLMHKSFHLGFSVFGASLLAMLFLTNYMKRRQWAGD